MTARFKKMRVHLRWLAPILVILVMTALTACGSTAASTPAPEPERARSYEKPPAPEAPAAQPMPSPAGGSGGVPQSEYAALEVPAEVEKQVEKSVVAESAPSTSSADEAPPVSVLDGGNQGPQGAAHLGPTQIFVPIPQARQTPRDTARTGAQPMVSAAQDPVSTFSLDADRASYHRALRLARQGDYIDPASVRAEEWINALDYGYKTPEQPHHFEIHSDVFRHPDTDGLHLVRIGIQAPEQQGPAPQVNVTLVIDTSGSMREGNRIQIVRQAAKALAWSLNENDNIGVVRFSDHVTHVWEHRPARQFREDLEILDLTAEGSTNVQVGLDEGLRMANQIRESNPQAFNYVILLSDGVANVNATDPFDILHSVGQDSEYSRRNPLRIITIGVGIQGYNDHLLEQIAQHGNGWYRYFDDVQQAESTFSRENWRRIVTPYADQARAQVTWIPETVAYWRIVGYENRVIADANFSGDLREFAEIPSGAATTVLYELQLVQQRRGWAHEFLGTIEVWWVQPISGESRSHASGISGNVAASLEELNDPLLEMGVYAGLSADIYASLDQGGYGTGGDDVFRRLEELYVKHLSLETQLGNLQAYMDVTWLLIELKDQAYQYYWQGDPSPVRGGQGSGNSP